MSYNIHFGGSGREERIAEVIRQAEPDIVLLQEATDTRVVERLSELTEMPFRASKRGQSAAFLSRIEPNSYEWHLHRKLQRAVLAVQLDGLIIYNVHLRATHSNYTERSRMREVAALLESLRMCRDEFHVLTGDFNTLAPGELLDMEKLPLRYRLLALMLGGRVTFRAIQMMLDGGYIDAYRMRCADAGYTFPAWDPHVRIDYVFVPQDFAERITSCQVMTDITQPEKATDHLPLIAEINV